METPMTNQALLVYLPYAAIAVALTVWLARTISHHGEVFLGNVFPGRPDLAHAINHLLVIGFYLVNLGWALLLLKSDQAARVTTPTAAIELLATKLGTLLLLLGVAHFGNLMIFNRIRVTKETA
jgi:hypothetical protein